ncbi:hypothetical protein OG948_35320 (plasmid) [Embleya sp. NBC_00888]|uniref:hypothetical protein n=1 Tax=Embleya sp. NBC_00888 TaxID=2975960 RepID=UPI002F918A5D|nr:hypothetical protein OG948_35320 [Embleya sp. NBC_00888]
MQATARFHAGRWRSELRPRERAAHVDENCAVYWRKPTHPDPDERWRADENTTALLGLLKAQSLRVWVNDPNVVSAARLKPAQLAVAARVGFAVPDTSPQGAMQVSPVPRRASHRRPRTGVGELCRPRRAFRRSACGVVGRARNVGGCSRRCR